MMISFQWLKNGGDFDYIPARLRRLNIALLNSALLKFLLKGTRFDGVP
jgi:hypothetical protein